MKSVIIAIILLAGMVYADIEFTRNADLNRWIERDKPECIEGVSQGDTKCIEWLFSNAWGLATQSSPVDNRAYLFSLAVDLYQTIEGDKHCPQYERTHRECGRLGDWMKLTNFMKNRPISGDQSLNSDTLWLRRGYGGDARAVAEIVYLKQYMRTYVKIASYKDPATSVESLDMLNPSNYASMSHWMAQNATAFTEGIPPWQAEEWTAANKATWERNAELAAETTQAVTGEASPPNPPLHLRGDGGLKPKKAAKKEVPPTQPEAPTKEPPAGPAVPWWVWVAGGVVVLVGGMMVVRGKKK